MINVALNAGFLVIYHFFLVFSSLIIIRVSVRRVTNVVFSIKFVITLFCVSCVTSFTACSA